MAQQRQIDAIVQRADHYETKRAANSASVQQPEFAPSESETPPPTED